MPKRSRADRNKRDDEDDDPEENRSAEDEEDDDAVHDTTQQLMNLSRNEKYEDVEVDVGFRFNDVSEADESSVRSLFFQGYTRTQLGDDDAVIALARRCCEQVTVGTTVKVEEEGEEDVLGYATVVPMGAGEDDDDDDGQERERAYSSSSSSSLKKRAKKKARAGKSPVARLFEAVLSKDAALTETVAKSRTSMGWVIRENVVNLPAQVAGVMYRCLAEDMEWASSSREADPTDAETFRGLKDLVLIAPYYSQEEERAGTSSSSARNKADKRRERRARVEAADYVYECDGAFAAVAKMKFAVRLPKPRAPEGVEESLTNRMKTSDFIVMIVAREDFSRCAKALGGAN